MMSEYWLISAPGDKTCQQTWETMNNITSKQNNLCENCKFHIPDLKVGTLDQLVGLSDDLGKLDTYVETITRKVAAYLGDVLEDQRDKLIENLMANNSTSRPPEDTGEFPKEQNKDKEDFKILRNPSTSSDIESQFLQGHLYGQDKKTSIYNLASPVQESIGRQISGLSENSSSSTFEWWIHKFNRSSNRSSRGNCSNAAHGSSSSTTHRSSPVSCCGSSQGRSSSPDLNDHDNDCYIAINNNNNNNENDHVINSNNSFSKRNSSNCDDSDDQHVASILFRIQNEDDENPNDDNNKFPFTKVELAQYITRFQWDMAKYPIKQSLRNIADIISKQVGQIDADLKTKSQAYNNLKGNLSNLEKKQTGSLLTRNLADLVKKEHFILDSEYLTTLLVIVPKQMFNDWNQNYEKLTDMIVPRSSSLITQDSDFGLFNVTLFKKVVEEFKLHAREKKFVVREFTYNEEELAAGKNEITKLVTDKKKQFGPLVRWLKVNFSECYCAWIHVKALRVFVESVLRYGLPVNFQAILIHPHKKSTKRLRDVLNQLYGHLDGSASSSAGNADNVDIPGLGFGQAEYFPYVFYKINIDMVEAKI